MEHQAMELTSPRDLSSRQRMPSRKAHRREDHLYHDICALGWDMSALSSLVPGPLTLVQEIGDAVVEFFQELGRRGHESL
jgi:hypothetical protein